MPKKDFDGPLAYANWNAKRRRKKRRGGAEFQLHGDSRILGEVVDDTLGPYSLLNTVPMKMAGQAPLVLRYWYHLPEAASHGPMDVTDTAHFHGGSIEDEVAALASLLLGVRLRAGGMSRRLESPRDCGRPRAPNPEEQPAPLSTSRRVLPARKEAQMDAAFTDRLASYPHIRPEQATGLARAASLYSDALWVADSQPELAWLLLVSAVEAGANTWHRDTRPDRVRLLRDAKPELVALLEEYDSRLVSRVARLLSDGLRATKKFRDFIMEFEPRKGLSPKPRWGVFEWKRKPLKKAIFRIYDYRSRALHEGIPFPLPMCLPPMQLGDAWTQVPTGHATGALGATWVKKDTPMLLHTFEYLVRSVLLSWWDSMRTDLG